MPDEREADRHTYLEVGVVRIHHYLSRTRDLKGLRGASGWISDVTDRDRLGDWIAAIPECAEAGLAVATDAGEADGVIPLQTALGVDVRPAAAALMGRIRERLPAVELKAYMSHGSSYVDAYQAGRREVATSLAAPLDFPALSTCGQCRVDAAVDSIDLYGEPAAVCVDCAARYVGRYRRAGLRTGTAPVRPEREMLYQLNQAVEEAVPTFDALARLGGGDTNQNHLATVCADGNGMGQLFEAAAKSGDPSLVRRLSRQVSDTTRAALVAAAQAVRGDDRVAVIPHVVGGDDLVVSVVADRAWPFVVRFLSEFSDRLGSDPAVVDLLGGRAPSAAAGVVFAHTKFPFRRCVELAESLQGTAKRAHRGEAAAVAWLDVTREGEQPPAARRSWTVADLAGFDGALRELRQVDAAARARLERLADPAHGPVSLLRLREHGRRLDRATVLDPFIAGEPSAAVAQLADALALARWWR